MLAVALVAVNGTIPQAQASSCAVGSNGQFVPTGYGSTSVGSDGKTVTFTATITGCTVSAPITENWTFGDGGSGNCNTWTSGSCPVTHVYFPAGTYSWTLNFVQDPRYPGPESPPGTNNPLSGTVTIGCGSLASHTNIPVSSDGVNSVVTTGFDSSLGQMFSEAKVDAGLSTACTHTVYGGNKPGIYMGLVAGLTSDATGSKCDVTYTACSINNFEWLKTEVKITDSTGAVFSPKPDSSGHGGVLTSVWDTPHDTGDPDYLNILNDIIVWAATTATNIPFPPTIKIPQNLANGWSYSPDGNTLVGQFTDYADNYVGTYRSVSDKALKLKILPDFQKPDLYTVTITMSARRGICNYNASSPQNSQCYGQDTKTHSYSFNYAYEQDAGQDGDAPKTLATARAILAGSYNGFQYDADYSDAYSFYVYAGQQVTFSASSNTAAVLYDTHQSWISGLSFIAPVDGTYFVILTMVGAQWGQYTFSLSIASPPTTPTLQSPSNGAVISSDPTLSWSASTPTTNGLSSYLVQLSQDPSFPTTPGCCPTSSFSVPASTTSLLFSNRSNPSIDAASSNGCASSSSCIATISTTTQPELAIVFVGALSSCTFSVSDTSGLTWSQRGAQLVSGNRGMQEFYALTTGILSGDSVTGSFSGCGTPGGLVLVFTLSGVDASSPFDLGVNSMSSATGIGPGLHSSTVTTSLTNDLVFAVAMGDGPTVPSGFTKILESSSSVTGAAEYTIVAMPASTVMSLNFNIQNNIPWMIVADSVSGSHGRVYGTTWYWRVQAVDNTGLPSPWSTVFSFKYKDFDVSVSLPPAVTVGTSSTSTITVSSFNGFVGQVSLTDTVPSGLTCGAITPASLTTSGTATLSCSSSSAVSYQVPITSSSGGAIHSTTVTFQVTDFTISANPTAVSTFMNTVGTSTITIGSLDGFASQVALTATVSPLAGLYCSFDPYYVNGGGTSSLNCNGSPGTYTLIVTGTSGSLFRTAQVTFYIKGFTINVTPSSLSIPEGRTVSASVAATSVNGYSGSVSLTVSLYCASYTLGSNTLQVPSGGSASTTMSITPNTSCYATTWSDSVTGTDTALGIASSGAFTLATSDFSIYADFTTFGIKNGGALTLNIHYASNNGYAGTTTQSMQFPAPYCCLSFGWGGSQTLVAGGSATNPLSITASGTGVYQNVPFIVSATDGYITRTVTLQISINDYYAFAYNNPATAYIGGGGGAFIQIFPYFGIPLTNSTFVFSPTSDPCVTVGQSVNYPKYFNIGPVQPYLFPAVAITASSSCTVNEIVQATVTITGVNTNLYNKAITFTIQVLQQPTGGGGSIAHGSLITLADGSKVPVQNLKVGDQLLGYDPTTGKYTVSIVNSIAVVDTSNMLIIHTTAGTPFRVDANPRQTLWVRFPDRTMAWTPVTQIKPGDELFTPNGWVKVTSIEFAPSGKHVMYDIFASVPYFADGYLDPIHKM